MTQRRLYTVNADGSVSTDDPLAALALAKLMAADYEMNHRTRTDAAWSAFIDAVRGKQRDALVAIRARGSVTLDDLTAELGVVSRNSVNGYLTGIMRRAAKAGLRPVEVFRRTVSGYGPNRVVRYRAGPVLRAHVVALSAGEVDARA